MVTLLVGGARSGKSSFAQSLYENKNDVVYIATTRIEDEEMQQRVNHHRAFRPDTWRTFEGTYNLETSIGTEKNYLLDCVTILTSNIMFDISGDVDNIDYKKQQEIEVMIFTVIHDLVKQIRCQDLNLIIVTNEVGCSIVPENYISRIYRDILGRVNQYMAELADEVYALFCGIPLKVK